MQHHGTHIDANRAALAPPFFLIVVDYDTRRFSVDGPTDELGPWDKEVDRMRRAGRDVTLFPTQTSALANATEWFRGSGFEEWPAGSIIEAPLERSAANDQTAGDDPKPALASAVRASDNDVKTDMRRHSRRRRRMRAAAHSA